MAREMGFPAVVGTVDATRRIANGVTVRVDGDAGTVTILGA
jgi:pyruvate,water dikinase